MSSPRKEISARAKAAAPPHKTDRPAPKGRPKPVILAALLLVVLAAAGALIWFVFLKPGDGKDGGNGRSGLAGRCRRVFQHLIKTAQDK